MTFEIKDLVKVQYQKFYKAFTYQFHYFSSYLRGNVSNEKLLYNDDRLKLVSLDNPEIEYFNGTIYAPGYDTQKDNVITTIEFCTDDEASEFQDIFLHAISCLRNTKL